jgi:hypothetical protein
MAIIFPVVVMARGVLLYMSLGTIGQALVAIARIDGTEALTVGGLLTALGVMIGGFWIKQWFDR